mmetsp:Transcript_20500/g.69485  ORF Transcript_20500/g.69485 Transcript_20500/m.69485 type:complete len:230 (+) Transcript_20500:235-924(+)
MHRGLVLADVAVALLQRQLLHPFALGRPSGLLGQRRAEVARGRLPERLGLAKQVPVLGIGAGRALALQKSQALVRAHAAQRLEARGSLGHGGAVLRRLARRHVRLGGAVGVGAAEAAEAPEDVWEHVGIRRVVRVRVVRQQRQRRRVQLLLALEERGLALLQDVDALAEARDVRLALVRHIVEPVELLQAVLQRLFRGLALVAPKVRLARLGLRSYQTQRHAEAEHPRQ